MPNWTENTIRAIGTPADLRAFLEAVKWEDKIFDFNRIIPMPELLLHTEKGFRTINGERVEAWYVMTGADEFPRDDQVRRFTAEEEALLEEIGYRNWYDWSVNHWGTKWNAFDPKADEVILLGYVEISFETAWAAPMPVFQKMFEMFPLISFTCSWQHEDDSERYSVERLVKPGAGKGGQP